MSAIVSPRAVFGISGSDIKDKQKNENQYFINEYTEKKFLEKDNDIYIYIYDNKEITVYPVWSLNYKKDNKDRFRWYYIREDSPYLKTNNIEKWKFIFPKTVAESIYRRTKILKPYEIFTDTFLCCFLDTEEQAKNLQTYFQTYLFRFLLINSATTQTFYRQDFILIPNLQNTKNPRTNKIGWNSNWTNEDLQELFDLTNDEMEYIKDFVIKSDNGKTNEIKEDETNNEEE